MEDGGLKQQGPVANAAQDRAAEGEGQSASGASGVTGSHAIAFLQRKGELTDAAKVGLHQGLINPELVQKVIRASRAGAKLATGMNTANKTMRQLVSDPAFDWGAQATKSHHAVATEASAQGASGAVRKNAAETSDGQASAASSASNASDSSSASAKHPASTSRTEAHDAGHGGADESPASASVKADQATTHDGPHPGDTNAAAGGSTSASAGEASHTGAATVQMRSAGSMPLTDSQVHEAAQDGVAGAGNALPHADAIQKSFGVHDVSKIQAHVGGKATDAANAMGAQAYATGQNVAFAQSPDLHTAAHEAAHVVQQRGGVQLKGGVGAVGDAYEQHADAVADRVVSGKSASDLLDAMSPSASAASSASVQRQVVQLDVKSDLRDAMKGWGSGEDKIFARLQRASVEELRDVVADAALMTELRKDLSRSSMGRVMDMLDAPLADKLRLAMRGWGYDERYMFRAVTRAPQDQVAAVARDTTLMGSIDSELSTANDNRLRAIMAQRVYTLQAELAFYLLQGSDSLRAARLALYGSIAEQRTLCDAVILASTDGERVKQAFQSYWGVECTAVDGAKTWPVPVLQAMHGQLKLIPDQDTRAGVWKQLALTSDPSLINRAAYGGGVFSVGSNASTTSTIAMGYQTNLGAAAATGTKEIQVLEGARLAVNDHIGIGAGAAKEVAKIVAISGNKWTLDAALTRDHLRGEPVCPDDGSAQRQVNWLTATVRHEIAHSVDSAIGGVKGFTEGLGGWWTGADFDTWAKAMGSPWATNDGCTISDEEKKKIKDGIVDAVKGAKGSLQGLVPSTHPIKKYWSKAVPVIVAAEACLSQGDGFYTSPRSIYGANGKRFSVSAWYKCFMYCKDEVLSQRVSDYSLYAPAEFFAESYTVYYEEAGKPGIAEADYGRLLRNSSWRSWIHDNIHDRGHAPAGTGASGSSPGAVPGSAGTGKGSGNPG